MAICLGCTQFDLLNSGIVMAFLDWAGLIYFQMRKAGAVATRSPDSYLAIAHTNGWMGGGHFLCIFGRGVCVVFFSHWFARFLQGFWGVGQGCGWDFSLLFWLRWR